MLYYEYVFGMKFRINVFVDQIGLRLTEVVKGSPGQRVLLDVSVEEMRADVNDRSWDAQGTVTIGNVSVLDHMSLGE